MSKYSRAVIPGRPADAGRNLDRDLFGMSDDRAEAANDHAGEGELEAPKPRRRSGKRATDDFRPLPKGDGRRDSPEARRAPIVLAGMTATILVFGVVVWNAYKQGVRAEGVAAAPQIADAGPFKARPIEPAADKARPEVQASVFDVVEPKKEDVAPTPEVRINTPTPSPAAAPKAAVVTPPAAPVVAATKPQPVQAVVVKPPPLAVPKAEPAIAAAPAAATAVTAAAPLAGGYKPVFAASGGYVVQVAAPSTEEAADAEWDKRKKAMPELFGAAERIIVRADVSGRTVYRVRAGSFAAAADADAFCAAIKAKGGDCFRTAK